MVEQGLERPLRGDLGSRVVDSDSEFSIAGFKANEVVPGLLEPMKLDFESVEVFETVTLKILLTKIFAVEPTISGIVHQVLKELGQGPPVIDIVLDPPFFDSELVEARRDEGGQIFGQLLPDSHGLLFEAGLLFVGSFDAEHFFSWLLAMFEVIHSRHILLVFI